MAKWINTKGWLKGYVSERQNSPINITQTEADKDINQKSTVVRLVLRCPRCQSLKLKCYGADRPVLYYKCNSCKWKFKVLEVDNKK
jgi:transposase-like protein